MGYNVRPVDVLVVVIGLVAGVGVALVTGGVTSQQGPSGNATGDGVTFASPEVATASLYLWPIQNGNISMPEGANLVSRPTFQEAENMLLQGDAEVAAVQLDSLPDLTARLPTLRVLPYQINLPPNASTIGLYVPENSSIQGPEDLEGTTILRPQYTLGLLWQILREEYGFDYGSVTFNSAPRNEIADRLRAGQGDVGVVGADLNDAGLRRIFSPSDHLYEQFGLRTSGFVFVVRNERLVGPGSDIVNTLNRSASFSRDGRIDQVIAATRDYKIPPAPTHLRLVGGVSTPPLITRMTDQGLNQLQYYLDLDSRYGNTTQIDLSEFVSGR